MNGPVGGRRLLLSGASDALSSSTFFSASLCIMLGVSWHALARESAIHLFVLHLNVCCVSLDEIFRVREVCRRGPRVSRTYTHLTTERCFSTYSLIYVPFYYLYLATEKLFVNYDVTSWYRA